MFFDISAKSQVNTFSINENYAGLVLASDINRLSCSTDKNSMNDNIFLIIPVIFTTLAVSGIMLTASKLLLVILIFQNYFFKDAIVCCISIPCIQEERKNFSFIYNGRSILFVDYDNFLTDIFSNIIEENINEIEESQDFIYFMLKSILKHDLENLNSISQNLSVLELNILTDSSNYNYNADQILAFRGNSLRLHHYYIILMDICRALSKEKTFMNNANKELLENLCDQILTLSNESQQIWEYTSQIRDVYQQKLSVNQSNIMKVLTIVTTIFMPLTLITGWYGMNFEYMKELHWKYGYPLLFGISVLVVGILCIIFKKKKWW
ncbi:MAG: CorA family divalent cation transporter [Eubacterium ventriosum]